MIQNLGFIPNLKKSDLIPTQELAFIGMEYLTQKYSQSTSGPSKSSYHDYQNNSGSNFGTDFPFSFGQTQCNSRLNSSRQTTFTTSANVPIISLETSRFPLDHQVTITSMIKVHLKWLMNTNRFVQGMPIHPPDPKIFLYTDASHFGWGAHLEPMSLSFHGRWSEDQSQLHINMLEIMAIRFTLIRAFKYIHHPCVMISTDNTTVVSYINKQGGTHSPNLCVEVRKILKWCLKRHIVVRIRHIPGKFNVLADRLSRIDKTVKTEWALDQSIANSIFQMFNYSNLDLFATRFNHKLPLYVSPVLDNQAFAIDAFSMNWNHLHTYAFPPTIMIPSVLNKIRRSQCSIVLIAPLWPQQTRFSEVLQSLVSAPVRLPLFPKLLTQEKESFNIETSQYSTFTPGNYQTIS